jgi:hypothetical protein
MSSIDEQTRKLCENPTFGSDLADKCLCINGFLAFEERTKIYEDSVAKYNSDFAKYQQYVEALKRWNDEKNATRQYAENARSVTDGTKLFGRCFLLANCPERGTWRYQLGTFTPPDAFSFSLEQDVTNAETCQTFCKMTQDTINGFMDAWVDRYPPPTPVVQPQQPGVPSGDNIQCCVNIMKQINATNINDVKQSCSQSIVQSVKDAATTTTTTTQVPTTPTKVPTTPTNVPVIQVTNLIKNILLGFSILFYIMLLILFIVLFKVKNKKVPIILAIICFLFGSGLLFGYIKS